MKKRIVLLIVLGLILYPLLVKTSFVGEFLLSQVNARLNSKQLILTADLPRASLLGLSAKQFSFKFPSALSSLDLVELHLAPSWMALLTGRIGFDLRAIAYAGNIESDVVASFKGAVQQFNLRIHQLSMPQVPLLTLAGLSNGALDVDLRLERLEAIEQRSGRVRIEARNIVRPQSQYSPIAELAKLPEINIDQLVLDGTLTGQRMDFEVINVNSDLGSAAGAGDLSFGPTGEVSQINIKLKFNLTAKGLETLGPLFQRSGDPELARLEPQFSVRISGSPSARNVRMVREIDSNN